jgi:hypothetical protein
MMTIERLRKFVFFFMPHDVAKATSQSPSDAFTIRTATVSYPKWSIAQRSSGTIFLLSDLKAVDRPDLSSSDSPRCSYQKYHRILNLSSCENRYRIDALRWVGVQSELQNGRRRTLSGLSHPSETRCSG